MRANTVKIGVLGGIGPEATATFYLELIQRLQAEGLVKDNTDFPQILINSIPAAELVFDVTTAEDLKAYENGLLELDAINPDFIVMVCNTIHLHYERLKGLVKAPLINLREEISGELKQRKARIVTVLGTPTTVKKGLYEFDGVSYINPTEAELASLGSAIHNFNKGDDKEAQKRVVAGVAKRCVDQGSEAVILGCTEFAVMLRGKSMSKIDSLSVLVNATVERFKTITRFK
ncbi:aspartate/glutamate racemase family protein [Candidatus Woesearchaeota archaeon]|nr:aspartate/glutamate racemase family protein [Candidatus Woesearchaeota archaeon]